MSENLTDNFCPLTDFGCIQITGVDTVRFLQGQITTNAEQITNNELTLSAMCTPQGRCTALFFITKVQDSIFLILHKETIEATLANIKKYVVFFKAEAADVSDDYYLYCLQSPCGEFPQAPSPHINVMTISQLAQHPVRIILAAQNEKERLAKLFKITTSSSQITFFQLLANQRIPWLTAETQNEFLPHNLNLPALKAVDFNKGCFTGQEVIARMQYKGKLKTHMQLFQIQHPLEIESKTKIWANEKTAGEVICSASGQQTTSVLALIKDNSLESEIFRLNDENGPILELIKVT
ncbi:CAF17-like 4Fe-4S cluster assembly/insertion protein YgfZ [Aliikangiella sp. IMCC44359]|uniref:CAF17-like 4Fe-4S cluster assembly/insertion protein YgfZ n=1 Tax=Aliikangiella sp. IMCC44359 TaxID=3459125 RepID=UPI00403B2E39